MKKNLHTFYSNQANPLNRGGILIVVLWLAIGLTSTALLFGHAMIMEYRAADNIWAGTSRRRRRSKRFPVIS